MVLLIPCKTREARRSLRHDPESVLPREYLNECTYYHLAFGFASQAQHRNKTTMKKRGVRLLTGALMPVAVAACMTFILIYIDQTLAHEETLGFNLLLFYLIMGYVVFGVQSILYSIVMEYIVNPMIRNHFIVVGISIALCMLFGAFSNISPEPIPAIIVVVPGFVTGLYLRWSYVKAAKKHIKSNPTTPHS